MGPAKHARRLLAALGCAALAALAPSAARAQPAVSGSVSGPPQVVFDTRTQSCERGDIPDQHPRAFRDDRNMVHLVFGNAVARAMVGPTLDTVKQDCRVMYRSPEDRDPSHFQDRNWLASFFSIDGRRVVALVHSEYDPWHFNACPFTGGARFKCYWTSISFALSNDGGYTFQQPPPPRNLVATAPYAFDPRNPDGPAGYRSPTNILQIGRYYYAMINAFKYRAERYGPCVMRTTNLLDPASWRGWDGQEFSVRFINPYAERAASPEQHVCKAVIPGEVDSLLIDVGSGHYVITLEAPDRRYRGEPGLYVAASADLIHWSRPTLLVSREATRAADPPGNWKYLYAAILDPLSTDRNFVTIGEQPYVYYSRWDMDHPPLQRVLLRRRITLNVSG